MGKIVLEDFNECNGYYKINLAYLNKEQVEEIEAIVSKWKPTDEDIKSCIAMCLTDANEQRFKDYGTNLKDCLAWLEKQGEQKPTDKIEPKFKVGDWIVASFGNVNQVIAVDEDGDGFTLDDGTYFSGSWKDGYHLWTIQDAKDGDVLKEDSCTFIVGRMKTDGTAITHCCLFDDGEFDSSFTLCFDVDSTYPATKEQRELLFQKMKEAGYEWDAEKKELKKVEQNPAWSVDDENRFNNLVWLVEHSNEGKATKEGFIKFINSLKTLKGRVQPQWKPSEEQMAHLVAAIEESNGNCILQSLYNDLKKL